jgi:hypothetical protein
MVGRKEQWKLSGVQHDTEEEPLVEVDLFVKINLRTHMLSNAI